jgi:plasmid stability protein
MYPSQRQDQMQIRLPDGMRDRTKVDAARNHRSMNAEIIHQLKSAYDAHEKSEVTA